MNASSVCRRYVYICNKSATPASTHFDGFSLVFRLKRQTYVFPRVLIR